MVMNRDMSFSRLRMIHNDMISRSSIEDRLHYDRYYNIYDFYGLSRKIANDSYYEFFNYPAEVMEYIEDVALNSWDKNMFKQLSPVFELISHGYEKYIFSNHHPHHISIKGKVKIHHPHHISIRDKVKIYNEKCKTILEKIYK